MTPKSHKIIEIEEQCFNSIAADETFVGDWTVAALHQRKHMASMCGVRTWRAEVLKQESEYWLVIPKEIIHDPSHKLAVVLGKPVYWLCGPYVKNVKFMENAR